MRMFAPILLLVVLPGNVAVLAGAAKDELKTGELIDRMIARTSAVFSGRMEYTFKMPYNPAPEPVKYSFSANSWALRFSTGRAEINDEGTFVEYVPGTGITNKGEPRNTARITLAEKKKRHHPFPPYFAGTFWYDQTVDYIKAHVSKARNAGGIQVDGIKCLLLQWDLGPEEVYNAFGSLSEPLKKGGRLNLYVAPSLGYALPKIEYVTTDGKVEEEFQARDFLEEFPGVFIPRAFQLEVKSTGFYVKYRMTKIEKINQDIPHSDFSVTLPSETTVGDTRFKKTATVLTVGEPTASADLSESLRNEAQRSGSVWPKRIVICLAVVIGAIFYYVLRKKRVAS